MIWILFPGNHCRTLAWVESPSGQLGETLYKPTWDGGDHHMRSLGLCVRVVLFYAAGTRTGCLSSCSPYLLSSAMYLGSLHLWRNPSSLKYFTLSLSYALSSPSVRIKSVFTFRTTEKKSQMNIHTSINGY